MPSRRTFLSALFGVFAGVVAAPAAFIGVAAKRAAAAPVVPLPNAGLAATLAAGTSKTPADSINEFTRQQLRARRFPAYRPLTDVLAPELAEINAALVETGGAISVPFKKLPTENFIIYDRRYKIPFARIPGEPICGVVSQGVKSPEETVFYNVALGDSYDYGPNRNGDVFAKDARIDLSRLKAQVLQDVEAEFPGSTDTPERREYLEGVVERTVAATALDTVRPVRLFRPGMLSQGLKRDQV